MARLLWTPQEPSGDPLALYDSLQYPEHGMPPRQGEERSPRDRWARFIHGQPIGKKVVFLYDAAMEGFQVAQVPIFQITAPDYDACQLSLTLTPPRIVAQSFAHSADPAINLQNLSGDQNNYEVSDGDFPGAGTPATWPPIQCQLSWGIGGHKSTAFVDFVNGTTISLQASFLQVLPVLLQTEDNGITGTSAAYELGGFLGPGLAARGRAPQNTVYVGAPAANAESLVFPIPPFARSAYVIGQDNTAAPNTAVTVATLRFWQNVIGDSATGSSNVGNFLFSGNQPNPAPIPNGAMYASVVNGMGATTRFSIVYDLDL